MLKTYNGQEGQTKFQAAKMTPYSVGEENAMLLKRLAVYKLKKENSEDE